MQRITITLDDPLVAELETYLAAHGYQNRSEGIRDLIRARIEAEQVARDPDGTCIANLTYIYNHHERELAARLTREHHAHHDLAVSTLHVHLDHDHCLETVVLRGPVARVRAFADAVITQPGVRHGRLTVLPVRVVEDAHPHGDQGGDDHHHGSDGHRHTHLEPMP